MKSSSVFVFQSGSADLFLLKNPGGSRLFRQPRQHNWKVSLLIDIQNNIKAQQSAGYQRWATIENLKRVAATMNFLTEHGIGNLGN